jgi:hypothetical protein
VKQEVLHDLRLLCGQQPLQSAYRQRGLPSRADIGKSHGNFRRVQLLDKLFFPRRRRRPDRIDRRLESRAVNVRRQIHKSAFRAARLKLGNDQG